ncbi:MAG: hypothetical protein ABL918_11320 [Chakrabartia sp.]
MQRRRIGFAPHLDDFAVTKDRLIHPLCGMAVCGGDQAGLRARQCRVPILRKLSIAAAPPIGRC